MDPEYPSAPYQPTLALTSLLNSLTGQDEQPHRVRSVEERGQVQGRAQQLVLTAVHGAQAGKTDKHADRQTDSTGRRVILLLA